MTTMLQELQPEPTTLEIVTTLINNKQPDNLKTPSGTMLVYGGVAPTTRDLMETFEEPAYTDDRVIAMSMALDASHKSAVWFPKKFQDMEKAWVAERESKIKKPL